MNPPKFYKDMSNNLLFNKNNNLHRSSNKNDLNNNKDDFNINKDDLNIKKDDFNMRIKKLLDNLQNQRKKIDNQYLLCLEDSKKNNTKKDSLDFYLNNVNHKYDSIYSHNLNNPYYNIYNKSKTILPPISPYKNVSLKIKKININVPIDSIQDILDLIDKYPLKLDVQYNINMEALHNIKKPLTDLNNMIGMSNLKINIVDQILYFSQNLHKNNQNTSIDFMHTVIYGPPGTGKTEIANIIGHIFSNLGILKNKIFKKATRSELIAGFLGQTAIKTKELVKSCLGGCLFIDEAYALGNREKRDSFAKECIDTLCEALSFYKNDIMVIIAGYEKDLKECFFAYNSGLESRFTWRFNTDDYNAKELNQIFQKKIKDIGWSLEDNINDSWFEKNLDSFKFFGRDIETLLAKTKIAHGRRVFCQDISKKRKISMDDLENGFKMFLKNNNKKKDNTSVYNMYL